MAGLAWMMQILTMLRFLIQYGISVWGFLGLTSQMLPMIAAIIIPFASFIAVMFVYNKLISDREITVMAASGMSPLQVARPAIIMAGILTVIHFSLSLYAVPRTQERFYDMQWAMRYGLAHLVIQEGTFTQMSRGLVAFVENVAGHDLSGLMLHDGRNPAQQMSISADRGRLVHTERGMSMVMTHGSVQWRDDNFIVGTFDSFDMDMNLADRNPGNQFRVRRMPTSQLLNWAGRLDELSPRNQGRVMSEVSNRFLLPLMSVILTLIGLVILLRASLIRRTGFNMTAPMATISMAAAMAGFMILADFAKSLYGIMLLGGFMVLSILALLFMLKGPGTRNQESGISI